MALDTTRLGEWIRMRGEVNLRSGPGVGTESHGTLPRHTVARVVACTGEWYRVELPDRSTGFVWAPLVDGLEAAVAGLRTSETHLLRDAPDHLAAPVDSLAPGTEVPVLGRFGDWTLVRSGEHDGWVFQAEAVAAG